jgi:hypothetical protein
MSGPRLPEEMTMMGMVALQTYRKRGRSVMLNTASYKNGKGKE